MREFSLTSVLAGLLLAVVFGCANAYLALKAGMTVSASIPAAVVAAGVYRLFLRRSDLLGSNMVQSIASAGESLAAGIAFTIPALVLLDVNLSLFVVVLYSLTGGALGILFISLTRRSLMSDTSLPFPEGVACANILKAASGVEGGSEAPARGGGNGDDLGAKQVLYGLLVGGVFKVLAAFAGLVQEVPKLFVKPLSTVLSVNISPAIVGAGAIIGPRLSATILAGGLLGWLVLIPLIAALGPSPLTDAAGVEAIWSSHIRYIGAGAVLVGGLVSLTRALPAVFRAVLRGRGAAADIPKRFVVVGVALVAVLLLVMPGVGVVGAILAIVFSLLFSSVSGRVVGAVGSSSNPISGMTIAALFVVALVLSSLGFRGVVGMGAALAVGAVVCISAAIAGDICQDLKTGQLVGATPWRQQVGELGGILVSCAAAGWVVLLLGRSYGFGSPELPAPQGVLMSLVVKGIFTSAIPWELVGVGGAIAASAELAGVSALPFAVGLYLPLELSTGLMAGGLMTAVSRRKLTVFPSGLIAGDALVGILVALLGVLGVGFAGQLSFGVYGSLVGGALLLFLLARSR